MVAWDRAAWLRADREALERGWDTAQAIRLDSRLRLAVTRQGTLLRRPARELLAHPPAAAAGSLLGVEGDTHLWVLFSEQIIEEPALTVREAALEWVAADVDLAMAAIAIAQWHRSLRSQPAGAELTVGNAGWSATDARGKEHFPRIDPAVITLVHDGAERVLLGRQASWPEGRYSLLAGFVEAGEPLEDAVRREILEEVGVHVYELRYMGSQPWPFPRSLMIGFSARADASEPIVYHDGEIADARWFTRAEVRSAFERGTWGTGPGPTEVPNAEGMLLLPPALSIAGGLLQTWSQPQR